MPGSVHDTYVAALQHDIAEVPDAAMKVGGVQRPALWFSALDENRPVLGSPEDEEFLEEDDRSGLWEDETAHMQYSYPFHTIGQFYGPATFLYDQHGQGIRNRGHLARLISNESDDDGDLYVAPADVHY